MIKVRIHLHNFSTLLDRSVYVETFLPAVPAENSIIYLTEDEEQSLYKQITKSVEKADDYFGWFGNRNDNSNFSERDFDNFDISEAKYVSNIFYFSNEEYVSIEIGNGIDVD